MLLSFMSDYSPKRAWQTVTLKYIWHILLWVNSLNPYRHSCSAEIFSNKHTCNEIVLLTIVRKNIEYSVIKLSQTLKHNLEKVLCSQ